MFDNQWIETNNNCVKIKETVYKPHIIVLKFVYQYCKSEVKQLN